MAYNWRQVVWVEAEEAFYGVHGNSGYLFRFDPRAGAIDVLERLTAMPSKRSGMFDQFSYGYLGFTLGPDGETLYYLTGGAIFVDGKRLAGKESTAKGESKGAKPAEHVAVAEGDHKVANDAKLSKDAKLAKDAKVAAAKPVKEEMLPSGVIGERLGKIFATMPTKDAAKILAQLDDQDVSLILVKVNDKKAGEMMALLPAERAAAISKKGIAHIASREKTP